MTSDHSNPTTTKTHRITVAIDGPAGAGKSTLAKAVAQRLAYTLVDTGAIYRAVALVACERSVSPDDVSGLNEIADTLDIGFRFESGESGVNRVSVDGRDVTEAIRTPEISRVASVVSAHAGVRQRLLTLQRRLAGRGGAVLEGRDIGTVVCPDAEVKIFLFATPEERARRRCAELHERGHAADYEKVLREQNARDANDANRAHAPLRPAEDAVMLDSTTLGENEVLERILEEVQKATDLRTAGPVDPPSGQ